MARARRTERSGARPPRPGEVALSPAAWLVALPAGAFAFATALRGALDRGGRAPAPPRLGRAAPETVLVAAGAPERSHRLRPLRVEATTPAVAAFLRHAESGIDAAARAAFAAEWAIDLADLESVAAQFEGDGVLLRG
jgi:hypothetical protein